ncbi:hypothetical protein BUALT_Bualt07G0092600 [Buddleja alternifolia]|uniref:Glyoxal oxidase n=1 Tax=Buddleja alternifolia TaxID=168488 RepID=A0AAV6XGC8_9LAMI|nr:hypothetical protein BUALT_Bualt07G0092600 [Buddleja alternifolia]
MSTTMFILFLLSLLFITHSSPATPQTLASHPGLQGKWRLLHESIGISAMHMQLMRNNKIVMFDRTDFGASNLSLPAGRCRYDPNDKILQKDCTAHSILYDVGSNAFRSLTVQTDTWCSSGAVLLDGTLVQTGGFNDGDHVIRTLAPCIGQNCDWIEFPRVLSQRRWYASNQILPDGRIIIVGGRGEFNYEFYPDNTISSYESVWINFLRETRDRDENNLYPFLHLLPDGNLFIFANTRSILFDYKQNRVIREFPEIPGGNPRNYPSSGSSVLLPINENDAPLKPEVMICGGAMRNAFQQATRGTFQRASATCARLEITDQKPTWKMENMPMPRVMGDMLILPNGDVIIINGAESGTAGWESARNPITRPIIYKPYGQTNNRFSTMVASSRPRLYHSTAILLTDGRVLVGGSNPHIYYNFTGVEYPTDLSLESFSPPYLSPFYDSTRPRIIKIGETMGYKNSFSLVFTVNKFLKMGVVSVRIVAPSFNTHSFSMNQRMVVLKAGQVSGMGYNKYRVSAFGPSTREIAPPGYYLLFIVHAGVPSSGILDGHAITLPPRLRPLFLQRLNEIKARRHGVGPLKDTTPSKKELLHDKDEDDNVSSHNPSPNVSKRMLVYSEEANVKETEVSNTHEVVKEERSRGNGEHDMKESTIEVAKAKIKHEGGNGEDDKKERGIGDAKENIENIFTEDEDEDEDEDDERMIGHEDDESFPGSPSFRVYFKDDGEDGHNDIGKNVAFKETASSDDGLSSKVTP